MAGVGVRLSDLHDIQMEAFRIEIIDRRWGRHRKKIIHRAELRLHGKWDEPAQLSVVAAQFDSLLHFFQRPEFAGKLVYTISTAPPEKDYAYLIDGLDLWL